MKKNSAVLRFIVSILAAAAFALPVKSYATFIIDTNPGGSKFYIDVANKDAGSFSGHVGNNNVGPIVDVATTGNVDTGGGYANIKPVKRGLLTQLVFTPADNTKYDDFSFRGQLVKDGDVHVRVIDQLGVPFDFTFTSLKANADFGRLGVVSTDGEWIESVTLYTTGRESFKEVKQIDFSLAKGQSVPEPSTFILLGAGLACLGYVRGKRRKNA